MAFSHERLPIAFDAGSAGFEPTVSHGVTSVATVREDGIEPPTFAFNRDALSLSYSPVLFFLLHSI